MPENADQPYPFITRSRPIPENRGSAPLQPTQKVTYGSLLCSAPHWDTAGPCGAGPSSHASSAPALGRHIRCLGSGITVDTGFGIIVGGVNMFGHAWSYEEVPCGDAW